MLFRFTLTFAAEPGGWDLDGSHERLVGAYLVEAASADEGLSRVGEAVEAMLSEEISRKGLPECNPRRHLPTSD